MAKLRRNDQGGAGFWCPGCDGPHVVPLGADGWQLTGTDERPTLSPSVLVRGYLPLPYDTPAGGRAGGVCHLFVRDGRIEYLADSTHALAGEVVAMTDW